jgi:hypothetical protein
MRFVRWRGRHEKFLLTAATLRKYPVTYSNQQLGATTWL